MESHVDGSDLVGGALSTLPKQAVNEQVLGIQINSRALLKSASPLKCISAELMVISDTVLQRCGYLDERCPYALHHVEYSLRVQSLGIPLASLLH